MPFDLRRQPGAGRAPWRAPLAVALAVASVAGCTAGEYTVAVRFPSAAVRERAAAVEVFVAPACDDAAVRSGAAPARVMFRRAVPTTGADGASTRLGQALPPGRYGVWVRARGVDCAVVAAGCAEHTLEAGGGGALGVLLAALDSPPAPAACESARAVCAAGICEEPGGDAGVPDASPPLPDGGCAPGRSRCGDACVSLVSDPANCGTCGVACAPLPGTTLGLCVLGRCLASECPPDRADCDNDRSNGCEADLRTAATCGSCNEACPASRPVCARNAAGRYDCSNDCPTRCMGACVDTTSDVDHCGACNRVCPSAPANGARVCAAGACGVRCNAGFHLCGGACASDTAPATCGASCTPCAAPPNATATCAGGACDFACNAGYVRSGGACVPSSAPCGNRVLDAGESCDDGNALAGDGCSPTCALEAGVGSEACGMAAITVRAGGVQLYRGTLAGAANDFSAAGCPSGGPDRLYNLQVATAGTLVVTVQPAPTTDVSLERLTVCPGLPASCTDGGGAGATETTSLPTSAGATGTLVVDSASAAKAGDYVLALRVM